MNFGSRKGITIYTNAWGRFNDDIQDKYGYDINFKPLERDMVVVLLQEDEEEI